MLSSCYGYGTQYLNVSIGLAYGFLYAGTKSVVASLWQVDDATCLVLMEKFYNELQKSGSVAKALRKSRLFLKQLEEFNNPKYWANFVLVGAE